MTTAKQRNFKAELMAVSPHCSNCGRQLAPEPNLIDSAFLVRKRLSCGTCVKTVRQQAADAKNPKPVESDADRQAREWNEYADRKNSEFELEAA